MSSRRRHVPPLAADEDAVVRVVARAILVLARVLDADLVREHQLGLTEYTTLRQLSEAPNRRLRMSQLAAGAALSISGMTRVVSRLEAQGLAERMRCPEDGRGSNAILTDAGLARVRQARRTHLRSTRRHVVDHLDGIDLGAFASALERFATQLDRTGGPGDRSATRPRVQLPSG
jgi:DNA-binding MarR family transcriptional regulator